MYCLVHGDGPRPRLLRVCAPQDIIRVRKASGNMASETVKQHMTSPAITIKVGAAVQEAADLMLAKKIRRLPVVDEEGFPVGILSRSDIFKPLFEEQYMQYMDKEVVSLGRQQHEHCLNLPHRACCKCSTVRQGGQECMADRWHGEISVRKGHQHG